MSDAINIQDIQTLYDLQSALSRFASGTQESLHAAEAEIGRTQEWLEERMRHWRREIDRAKRTLDQAVSDLRRCEASGYRDDDGHYHQPDCGREAQAARRAGERLHECEENLKTTQAWRSRVEQAVDEYQREARQLSDLVGGHTEKAHGQLGTVAAKYEAVQQAANTTGVGADAVILEKMAHGIVDLSKGTEWGKFAHHAYQGAAEAHFPGEARSEVGVEITKPDGSTGKGRIDTLLGNMIIDYKTHDLDHPSEAALARELGKIATQLHGYRASPSPDVSPGSSLIVLFEFAPSDPGRRSFVEDFFKGQDIQVLWGGD